MNETNGFNNGWSDLFLLTGLACSGIHQNDDTIQIRDRLCLIDEDMEEVTNMSGYLIMPSCLKENTSYTCVRKWDIVKNSSPISSYSTKEEAEAAFNEIVQELTKDKKVIKID